MVLVRTELNREYVVYPSGANRSADTLLLDIVHDTPLLELGTDTPQSESSSHTPYVESRFPTPLIEIGFLKGWTESRFTNHHALTIIMTVTHHCTQIHDTTDHTNNQMDNHQANHSIA